VVKYVIEVNDSDGEDMDYLARLCEKDVVWIKEWIGVVVEVLSIEKVAE